MASNHKSRSGGKSNKRSGSEGTGSSGGQRFRLVRSLTPLAVSDEPIPTHKRIVIGVEIEAYSIQLPDFTIGRRHSRPRSGVGESGERFTIDSSIGSEYNSMPFSTIREALFLLKTGLRKYLRGLYRGEDEDESLVPLLVGGWTNRFAGTHMHVSVADQELTIEDARSLAGHVHDHLPLLIAVCANSPIWDKRVTGKASNRLLKGTDAYFKPVKRGKLTKRDLFELKYVEGRKTKPPTLELRMFDSNIPEFIVAALTLLKASALRWLRNRGAVNRVPHEAYLQGRADAGMRGMKCRLAWKDEWLPATKYLDRFLWEHRDELEMMDVPDETWDVFRLLKRGYNGARIIHDAANVARKEHVQTWQRRFAKRYSVGLQHLLSGNTLRSFVEELGVELPDTEEVWLGRRTASVDG